MLVDPRGRPIGSAAHGFVNGRRGEQVDGFQLPSGAIVSEAFSRDFHNRIKNDPILRERLETAARMTGKESLHLAALRNDSEFKAKQVEEAIFKNLREGEKVQRARAKSENLTESKEAYAKLSS
jgi:hypothetical protein